MTNSSNYLNIHLLFLANVWMWNLLYGTIDSSEKMAIGEKGTRIVLKLRTYTLLWSFNHTSHRCRSISFIPHHPFYHFHHFWAMDSHTASSISWTSSQTLTANVWMFYSSHLCPDLCMITCVNPHVPSTHMIDTILSSPATQWQLESLLWLLEFCAPLFTLCMGSWWLQQSLHNLELYMT